MTRLNVEQAKITTQFPSTKLFPSIRLLYIRHSADTFEANIYGKLGRMLGRPTFYLPSSSFREICLPILSDGTTAFCNCFLPGVLFSRDCFPSLPRFETKLTVDDGSFGRLSNQDFIFSPVAFFYYSPFAVCACVRVCKRIKKRRKDTKDGCPYFEENVFFSVESETVNKIYVPLLLS